MPKGVIKRQWFGLRRSLVRKTLNGLNSLVAADNRAKLKAQRDSTVPLLFGSSPAIKAAMTLIQTSCIAALKAMG